MSTKHAWTVVGVLLLTAGVVGIIHQITAITGGGGLPSWLVPFGLGVLAGVRGGFRAGQYARGYAHARGIRRSHWNAIRGGH